MLASDPASILNQNRPDLGIPNQFNPEELNSQSTIPKSGNRFPAFAKPASAGEGRSEKIMLKRKI